LTVRENQLSQRSLSNCFYCFVSFLTILLFSSRWYYRFN